MVRFIYIYICVMYIFGKSVTLCLLCGSVVVAFTVGFVPERENRRGN